MKVVTTFMIDIDNETKKHIVDIIKDKGADSPCPMCANKSWELADSYFKHTFQYAQKGSDLSEGTIPIIGMICKNCGFISEHALDKLGKLEDFE
jgi:hypothetical protein